MSTEFDRSEFKIGEWVRRIGDEAVGEVVNVGDGGVFVRYKTDSSAVMFYTADLLERVKSVMTP